MIFPCRLTVLKLSWLEASPSKEINESCEKIIPLNLLSLKVPR